MDLPLNLTRSVLTILIPGAVASAPWLLWALIEIDPTGNYYEKYAFPIHVLSFVVAVVVGSIINTLVSYIELAWDNSQGSKDAPKIGDSWLEKDWYAYLSSAFGETEPVGYRYLSHLVSALYFELGMIGAVPIGVLAVAVFLMHHNHCAWAVASVVAAAAFGALFYKTAQHTHLVLCKTRREILRPPNVE